MRMPKLIRRMKRKRDWYAYGRTNKRIRELSRRRLDFVACCPGYVQDIDKELDALYAARRRLYNKLLTPEVF